MEMRHRILSLRAHKLTSLADQVDGCGMGINYWMLPGVGSLSKKHWPTLIHIGPLIADVWINRYQEWQDHAARVHS